METFKPDWEEWIDLNLRLGNCKQIMFQKSLDVGYAYDLIKSKLNIDYNIIEQNIREKNNRINKKPKKKVNKKK